MNPIHASGRKASFEQADIRGECRLQFCELLEKWKDIPLQASLMSLCKNAPHIENAGAILLRSILGKHQVFHDFIKSGLEPGVRGDRRRSALPLPIPCQFFEVRVALDFMFP